MTVYKAPLRDYKFVLEELFDVGEIAKLPGYEEATPDMFAACSRKAPRSARRCCSRSTAPATTRGALRERRGAHAQGLQGSLRSVPPRRLDRAGDGPGIWRPGPARDARILFQRNGGVGQPVVRHVSGPVGRRVRRDPQARRRRAEKNLAAEDRRRHLVRHDVPDRAAMRHRPRPDQRAPSRPTATASTKSPAPRFSSPPASTI